MAKSISVKRKKPGRPATGTDPLMGFRASPVMRASVVRWAETQLDKPSLSEAIRQLVELGLTVKTKARSTGRRPSAALMADLAAETIDSLPPKPVAKQGRRSRAQQLAKAAIQKMADPSASPKERDHRRRRLTKGPPEFREDRVDQPKAKGK